EAAKRVERTRAGRDARAQEGRVDGRLPRPELVGADRQRVRPARVLGAEAARDPVAPVLLEPDVDAELAEHATVRLPLQGLGVGDHAVQVEDEDRKSTRLNSSHDQISYAVFCLKKQ